jgi:hypothetical protein
MGKKNTRSLWQAQPAAIIAALVLMACQSAPAIDLAKTSSEIAVLRLKAGEVPPPSPGKCWASDTSPAVIETITEQVQVRPERRDSAGNITQAAQFQTHTAQRMVSDRATVWFAAPCPSEITVGFVASLQRALKARGRFYAPVTGAWDDETLAALQKFQRERGLDSPVISLAAAQELGLIAAGR